MELSTMPEKLSCAELICGFSLRKISEEPLRHGTPSQRKLTKRKHTLSWEELLMGKLTTLPNVNKLVSFHPNWNLLDKLPDPSRLFLPKLVVLLRLPIASLPAILSWQQKRILSKLKKMPPKIIQF